VSGKNVLGYTGSYLEPVIGAYPLGNGYRMYLPWLQRFSAPDSESPFAAGGVNCYAYCAGDPINRADPTGHNPLSVEEIYNEIRREVQPMEQLPGHTSSDLDRDPAVEAQAVNPVHSGQGTSSAGQVNAPANGSAAGPLRSKRKLKPDEWGPLPSPLKIKRIPTDPAGLNKLVTDAYHLGQLKIIPYDDIDSTVIAEWQVNIELNGESLGVKDKRLDNLLKPLGFSRQNSAELPHIPWVLGVDTAYPSNILVNLALGGPKPGPDGFRLLHLPSNNFTHRYPRRVYSRVFNRELRDRMTSFLSS
jgi:RHS repeat-associated protein